MYIPDPIEIMENCAERWAEENISGDNFRCSCGKICHLSKGQTIDSNPYSPPVCPDCFEEWYDLKKKESKC